MYVKKLWLQEFSSQNRLTEWKTKFKSNLNDKYRPGYVVLIFKPWLWLSYDVYLLSSSDNVNGVPEWIIEDHLAHSCLPLSSPHLQTELDLAIREIQEQTGAGVTLAWEYIKSVITLTPHSVPLCVVFFCSQINYSSYLFQKM